MELTLLTKKAIINLIDTYGPQEKYAGGFQFIKGIFGSLENHGVAKGVKRG